MSSTRKARNPSKEDVIDGHEEKNLWMQIRSDIERCAIIQKKQKALGPQIKDLEEEFAKTPPTAVQIDELQSHYRDLVKLTNEEEALLNDEPSNILGKLDILIALREASAQNDTDYPRNPRSVPIKTRPNSRKPDNTDSAAESPGPSPLNQRINKQSTRGTSVGRDIKVEEGTDSSKGPSAEKAGKFFVGAEVAYKQAKPRDDGSQWIICNIAEIHQMGSKKRYQVQDPEPDDLGNPGEIYITSASSLIAIPALDQELPDYPIGKQVLARYPETTTFYRAEVIANSRKGYCRLRFEDDQNQEMEVLRRFVLNIP